MSIEQWAGDMKVEALTGGSPIWTNVYQEGRQINIRVMSVSDLHDLRYCIDRVLAQLGERAK